MANLLPLDRWRELLQLHPLRFFGLSSSTYARSDSRCQGILPQYAWQDEDSVSRSEIARAIEEAEALLASYLGYYPAPMWREVTLPFPRPSQTGLHYYGASTDPNGQWLSVILPDRYVQAVGVEVMDYLGDADITATDQDGDGFSESFSASIEIPTAITDPNEIVCFPRIATTTTSDGSIFYQPREYGQAIYDCEDVPIGNLCVEISRGQNCAACHVADITGPRWLTVRPQLYETLLWNPAGLSATGDQYVSKLAVYRKYISAGGTAIDTAQAVLYWETTPCPYWGCTSSATNNSSDPATVGYATARVGLRNAELGHVMPAEAVYNSITGLWQSATCLTTDRLPDRVTIRYLAGYPWKTTRRMDNRLEQAVVALSAARLNRPICAGLSKNAGETRLYSYQFDLARSSGANDEQYGYISGDDLRNPLGTRRGEVQAWHIVQNLRISGGVITD